MAKKKRRKSGFNSQKVMKYVRLAALLAPAANIAMQNWDGPTKVNAAISKYTGYRPWEGRFVFEDLAEGWTPYLASILATYGIPKIAGIIRGL